MRNAMRNARNALRSAVHSALNMLLHVIVVLIALALGGGGVGWLAHTWWPSDPPWFAFIVVPVLAMVAIFIILLALAWAIPPLRREAWTEL